MPSHSLHPEWCGCRKCRCTGPGDRAAAALRRVILGTALFVVLPLLWLGIARLFGN